MKIQDFINSWKGIEHFVLVIQIIRVERKEENPVLVNSKKGEGRNEDFILQNKKN